MEAGTNQNKLGLLIAEASGTAIFLTAIFFTALFQSDSLTVSVGVGGGLFIAITCFGRETGGHFNPAVSTGYFFWRVKNKKKYFQNYIILLVAQLLGGMIAGLLLFLSSKKVTPVLIPDKNNLTGAFLSEILFTTMFLLIIFCVKSRHVSHSSDGMLGALTVSLALMLTVLYGGSISGACYNPAVGIAINFWSSLSNWDFNYLQYIYIYLIGPLIGGLLAGMIVSYFLDKKIQKSLTIEELDENKENKEEDLNTPILDKLNESAITQPDRETLV